MQAWPMRVLGALNILFVLLGAFYSAAMVQMSWKKWLGSSFLDWIVFAILSAISVGMVLYLAHLGIRLIKKDVKALWHLCLLFVAEIAYFVVVFYVTWFVLPDSLSAIAAAFWGMAQNPIVPQIVTGYPLVGLVITLVILLIRHSPPETYRR
jgi:hypothetical protein